MSKLTDNLRLWFPAAHNNVNQYALQAADRIDDLETAISETLEEYKDFAEGDNCPLSRLRRVMGVPKPVKKPTKSVWSFLQ